MRDADSTSRRDRRRADRAAAWGALFLAGLLAADVARADPTPVDDAPAPTAAPDLSRGVEEVAARLRQLDRSLADDDVFAALQADATAAASRTTARWEETGRLLQGHLRPSALNALESSWQTLRADLDAIGRRVDARADQRDADLATLTALQASWNRSLEVARGAAAPDAVLDRVQDALSMIGATRSAVEQRRARLLVLQDTLSRAVQTCGDAIDQIQDVRRAAIERIVTPQQPPLWSHGPSLRPDPDSDVATASDLAVTWESVRAYAATYRAGLVLSGLTILVCMGLLRRARSLTLPGGAHEEAAHAVASAFQTPYASAVLLGLLLSRPLRPHPPFALQQMVLAVVTLATVFVLRPFAAARVARPLHAFAALLLVSLASSVVAMPPRGEQAFLALEMAVAALLLLWGNASLGAARPADTAARAAWTAGRVLVRVVGVGCAVSAVAAALGYLDLADFVGTGLLQGLFVALALLAIRITLDGVVTVALTKGPLAQLHTVARHRDLIGRRARLALDIAAIALWGWLILGRFDLLEPVTTALNAVLDARLRAGELDLPLSRVFAFIAVVVGIILSTRAVGTFLEDDVYARMTLPRGVPYALSTLTRYGLLLVGFLLALATLGLDLTRITVLVSALGLGLGFGLQEVMNNFVSGVILLFERPVQVGDTIEMGDVAGEIRRIGIRSSTVRTSQGAEVIVPNSKMISERVTNWTLSDRRRRIDLDVGVKGDADAERIIALLNAVVREDARVASAPPPVALLVRFGEDSMDFQVRCWTDERDWMHLRSDLSVALQRALRAARAGESDRA